MFGGLYLRVFAGMPLPDKVKSKIGLWICENRKNFKSLKFVNSDLLHITLFFFGELEKEEVEKLKTNIKVFIGTAVKASLGNISFFPSFKKPNVFYISMKQGSEQVSEIYNQFALNISKLGYKLQGKKFVPHITFARRKKGRGRDNRNEDWSFFKNINFNIQNIILSRLVLYQSVLKQDGPEYLPITTNFLDET